jgi:predicted DNA-binding transcriptional regulator AlpA
MFPRRVSIGASRYGYVESEIDAYIERKIAERDAGVRA